jgi:hypothetical protein
LLSKKGNFCFIHKKGNHQNLERLLTTANGRVASAVAETIVELLCLWVVRPAAVDAAKDVEVDEEEDSLPE